MILDQVWIQFPIKFFESRISMKSVDEGIDENLNELATAFYQSNPTDCDSDISHKHSRLAVFPPAQFNQF